ncbi:MAG: acyl-CoA synthetase [Mangrovicoccus sp.]|nr:acyl-CoA synthetase [Mangrovicoccus sp.]
MTAFTSIEASQMLQAEMPWENRDVPSSVYEALSRTKQKHGDKPAISFQITSEPKSKAKTLSWNDFHGQVTQAANLFRSLGVGDDDVVAFLLPNSNETTVTLIGGMTAGIVNPINPLLDVEQIAGILNETKAKVLVTLKAFPKSDVAEKAAEAVRFAPSVKTILEIDLLHYLSPPKSWIVPLVRPKVEVHHHAKVLSFRRELLKQPSDKLTFAEPQGDNISAYFHTGGTTGTPKVAQHKQSGMIYNGWLGSELIFNEKDVMICPLPMFHVFACYPIMMSAIFSGAHVVFPTPSGYRGDGVFDNFWKLIERWNVTFLITVPTALSALMQRPVDADVSSLKTALSGSAALPVELYNRFQEATGVAIAEGYGMTEATCLVSCNPIEGGLKKVGSVGIPLPYTDVRILHCESDGSISYECGTDEVGEICISNPGVFNGSTYTEEGKNLGLYADRNYLRTGDLGRVDEDGYLWITGRQKDLIIRGGHNIDPAEIEEALMGHPKVAMVAAIGQPDQVAGELPCAYVELVEGAEVTVADLVEFGRERIHERAAVPKHLEILDELPKTGVGKVFKPDLRKMATKRVYDKALKKEGLAVNVAEVVDDKKLGLTVILEPNGDVDDEALKHFLGRFTMAWRWKDAA